MIEIIPVGGYSEIGRNCTVIKYKDDAIMIDLGLKLEEYIRLTQDQEVPAQITQSQLIREKAVPDLNSLDELKDIKAICISHAHLDHLGAIPFFANKIKCPIHATKFTTEVLKEILRDKRKDVKELIVHEQNSRFKVTKNIDVEFIHITHSTPQSVVIAVHTPEGTVVYANDFKLDNAPTLGKKPNYKALKKLEGAKALIMDSLYSQNPRKTPSESIAKQMLKDVLTTTDIDGKNIIVTTFSSHIARIKAIVEFAELIKRKPVFIGRSLSKYIDAAKESGIVDFEQKADFIRFGSKLERFLKKETNSTKKLYIVTGHQGEPKAILSRLSKSKLFPFKEEDLVIFSCQIIPTEDNYKNREKLEAHLTSKKVRIFRDIHVSGHASREDHREFINIIKPKNIIPTHGDVGMLKSLKELALQMNYKYDNIHILTNFSKIYI